MIFKEAKAFSFSQNLKFSLFFSKVVSLEWNPLWNYGWLSL